MCSKMRWSIRRPAVPSLCIDEAELPFLFQRFYKGRQAQAGSVGIGLALAKTILQSQNGDITAGNAPEGGAQFVIKLYKQIV